MEIALMPDTLPTITQVVLVYCWAYQLLLVLVMKVFMVMRKVILVVMMKEVDVCLKRLSNLTFANHV